MQEQKSKLKIEQKSSHLSDYSDEVESVKQHLINRGAYRTDKHHVAGIFNRRKDRKVSYFE